MNTIMIVAGTRPEVIKLSPIIKWLQRMRVDFVFAWSGQHYDYELNKIFFEQLGLPDPDINFDIGSGSDCVQVAKAIVKVSEAIAQYDPYTVVSEGDTNTVGAAALATIKTEKPFTHVEAGLRSFDRTMPEEINRVVADSCSELLFAPTETAVMNLVHEGIPLRKIQLTGNPIVDVVEEHRQIAGSRASELVKELKIDSNEYLLLTFHRKENTDDQKRLSNIVKAILLLAKRQKIVFPIHPRTRNRLLKAGLLKSLTRMENLRLLPPLGYFEFLGLLSQSLAVLTDSGGVQEEALTLRIPTITMRYNTERPETVVSGVNVLAGSEPETINKLTIAQVQRSEEIRNSLKRKRNPLGDGKTGEKIARALKSSLEGNLRVQTSDTRDDPYIQYALVKTKLLDGVSKHSEILATYDQKGYSKIESKDCKNDTEERRSLIRASRKRITELLESTNESIAKC